MLPLILCGHQGVAGLNPRWEEVCFGLQQCQTNRVDRKAHEEEGTSLRDE